MTDYMRIVPKSCRDKEADTHLTPKTLKAHIHILIFILLFCKYVGRQTYIYFFVVLIHRHMYGVCCFNNRNTDEAMVPCFCHRCLHLPKRVQT